MAQQQKAAVRTAILEAAFELFSEQGYTGATVPQIAATAGVSTANIYVYFRSKLEIVFAIYEPWLRERLQTLEHEIMHIRSPDVRLRRLVTALWRDIPAANNGFTTNIMQAISAGSTEQGYRSDLIRSSEGRVAEMLRRILSDAGAPAVNVDQLAHLMFMAFDGFSINYHLNPWATCSDDAIELLCGMLLHRRGRAMPRREAPKRRRPLKPKSHRR